MSDPREALVALLGRPDHAPMSTHDPRDGSCQSCPWPLHEMPPEDIADAILAEFDVSLRGEGTTIEIGGRRAGKTQALAERVADEVMKRGGSATGTSLPSVEDVARLLYERFSQNRLATWDVLGDVDDGPGSTREWYRDRAREVLELLPGRTEAEVRQDEAERIAAWVTADEPSDTLVLLADALRRGDHRG